MGYRVAFTVPGTPVAWKRPAQGIDRKTGRTFRFTDQKAEAGKVAIAKIAKEHWKGGLPTGPVILRVVGIFAIPPSWPVKVKAAAMEARVLHIADPDLDQIVKLAQDALVGIAYVDDNQVCGYPNSAKRYGCPERTEITIEVLDQQDDERTPGQRRLEARPPEHLMLSEQVANKLKRNRSKTQRPMA